MVLKLIIFLLKVAIILLPIELTLMYSRVIDEPVEASLIVGVFVFWWGPISTLLLFLKPEHTEGPTEDNWDDPFT